MVSRTSQLIDTLKKLSMLQDGWCEGGGAAISPLALSYAHLVLAELMERQIGLNPFVYPSPEGGVHIEWDSEDGCTSAVFYADKKVYLHTCIYDSEQDSELTVDLGEDIWEAMEQIGTALVKAGVK